MLKKSLLMILFVSSYSLIKANSFTLESLTPTSHYTVLKIDGPRRGSQDWSTFKTLAMGAGVGAGTGILARMIDSSFPGKLFYWYLTFSLRNAIIYSMAERAHDNGEKVDSNLLYTSAWISDWISYLMLANLGQDSVERKQKIAQIKTQYHIHHHH